MITTRTPLRVSLVGGGTDVPSFYQYHTGAVVSTAINKYIYISINPKFDGRYRVSYSRTENVDNVADIQHDIVREVMKLFQVKGLEVVSISDIPGEGSGLGSSSAFTVGLLRAMYAYCDYNPLPRALAEHAFTVEAKSCGHPVGKQDHYAAALGGLYCHEFRQDRVKSESLQYEADELQMLNSFLMLFWLGARADGVSEVILQSQRERLSHGNAAEEPGLLMAELAQRLRADLKDRNFDRLGKFIHSSWVLKKQFSSRISTVEIDDLITGVLKAGATGAKICGAGGGGFLLVVADLPYHLAVEKAVGLRAVPFKIGMRGSTVVYQEE